MLTLQNFVKTKLTNISQRTFVMKDLPYISKMRESLNLPTDENFKNSLPVVSETMNDS